MTLPGALPRSRGRWLAQALVWVGVGLFALAGAGYLYLQYRLAEPVPLPAVRGIDLLPRFFDLRPVEVVTTANWLKFRRTITRDEFFRDHTIWQQMAFEDWDRLTSDVWATGLDRLLARYGTFTNARDVWPVMTPEDWDQVPQPVRAMAFVGMIEHWVAFYKVGRDFDLDPREVLQTTKAIAMNESWFDHRARHVNRNGSTDIGLGGTSGFARRTVRRLHAKGLCDFVLGDEEYQNPWLTARWLAFWVNLLLHEADGNLELAVRAYNTGIGRATRGAGDHYLATVLRRRDRYFQGPSGSNTWRVLSRFRRANAYPARATDEPTIPRLLTSPRRQGPPA